MSFTYLLPITNIDNGITPRVELLTSAGASLNFADGASAKLATAVGGSSYFLYSTHWPSGSDLPFNIKVSNHSTGSLLGTAAFNSYDVPVSIAGAGGISTTLTIEDASSNPIQGVDVWVTTDAAGTNTIAGTVTTDSFGNVTFYLDAGTYYVWKLKPNYTFTNPAQITVS
jgi:hypothetical protein